MGTITRTFANQIKTGGKLDADGLDLTDTFAFTGTVTGAGLSGWSENGENNNLLPASSSAGIYLGVNSATAANLLDDYEEGTWTPVSTFADDTASGQAGAYTKVGNMVVATFQIVFSTTSFGIDVGLSGLPFTSNSTTGNASGSAIGFYNGTSTTLQLYLAENTSQLNLRDIDGNIQHNTTKVLGKTLRGVVVYRTA